MNTIYDYSVLESSGQEKSLKDFSGKGLLVVNTASGCYFRKQFTPLEELYLMYMDQGFEVLAFPSDIFLHQEPRTGTNLVAYCRLQVHVSFPVFKCIRV